MAIVGFSFTKIEVEKKESAVGKVNISNNVVLKDVIEASLPVNTVKQKAIKFVFQFTSKYEPNVGKIVFGGEVLYLQETAKVKNIISDWKKSGQIEKNLMAQILNTVLAKCNVQALILSQEVNLPSPIPLPKVKMEAKKA
ncbi:hypothetical protein GOV09_04865 [Candidatus Woesearchaeota archaeon]|nr:hypothetical protein [Candidatus Woesearchaeota archaeon]